MLRSSRPHGLAAVEYDERFLEASWNWLNDPEARRLNQTQAFTREEQRAWFDSLPGKSDYCIWGIELNGIPIGAMGLKGISEERGELWCYIGEKSLWGRGIGNWIGRELIERARQRGLKQLYVHVVGDNKRVIRLAQWHGFVEIGKEGAAILMKRDLTDEEPAAKTRRER